MKKKNSFQSYKMCVFYALNTDRLTTLMYVIITHIFTHIHILYFGSRWMIFCCCILEKFWCCFFCCTILHFYTKPWLCQQTKSKKKKYISKKPAVFCFSMYIRECWCVVNARESPIQIQFFLLFKFLFGSLFAG